MGNTGGCCQKAEEKEKKETYECENCGRTSEKQEDCCGKPMKKKGGCCR